MHIERTHGAARAARKVLDQGVIVCAVLVLAVLLAFSGGYGYHRDELYFIVAGAHPAFGYPDQPPLVPILLHLMHSLAPGSLLMIRLPSAVAAAVTVLVAGLIARELGGTRAAQTVAAATVAVTAILLATGHFVTTTTFDLMNTTIVGALVIRALHRHRGGGLFAAGVVAGLGAQAKPQVLIVYGALLVAAGVVGPRWPLRSRGLWAGVVAAVALIAPYLAWQALNGWPQLTVAAHIAAGSAEGGRAGFVPFQLVLVSPFLVPVWVAGLVWAWRSRWLRLVPVAYLLLAAAYLLGNGKAYYLASLYPTLLGIGAVPTVAWLARGRRRVRVGALGAALALSAVVNGIIALPVLPARDLTGSPILALNPDQAETVGWPEFTRTISRAWQGIPAETRAHTAILTGNYGEAGAVQVLGAARGLPAAYSGHNGFSEWGPPPSAMTSVLLVGLGGPADVPQFFGQCRQVAQVTNAAGVPNQEAGGPVLFCGSVRGTWATLWPQLRHYD